MPPKIALLIDAENISYKYLPHILSEAATQGQIILRAAYGNWQSPTLSNWHTAALAHNFKIRHQANSTKTKNSSDMKLIMDAMEVLYCTPVETFCLVTNDADYVALCEKIRESRKRVIGIGYPHASDAFIRACDRFIFIGRGESPSPVLISPTSETTTILPNLPVVTPFSTPLPVLQPSKPLPDIRKLLVQAFAKVPRNTNGWVLVSALGDKLRQVKADFKPNIYGHSTLSKLLQSMPDFVELRGQGGSLAARLK